jgi:nicotinamidase/pyrazinamidase
MSFAEVYGAEPFTMNDTAGQMVWPVHCVQGTQGAELHPDLDQKPIQYILRKGMQKGLGQLQRFLGKR